MKNLIRVLSGIGLLFIMTALQSCSSTQTGPNGGDMVTLNEGQVKAEIVANADMGGIMVHTWDPNLKNSRPVENKPLMIGSGDNMVELQPYPKVGDPSGTCSRFYGQADWLRGGQVRHGWLSDAADQNRHEFTWNNCWRGGAAINTMWKEMAGYHRGMMGTGQMGPQ